MPDSNFKSINITLRGKTSFSLTCELADSPEKRNKGLMYRKNLEKDGCMLFVFPEEEILYFWMKDTYIPLDIAFMDKEGKILAIKKMQPQDTTPVSSVHPAKYALEMNQNWFFENNIKEGDYMFINE